jgi:hypothetical protein
MGYELNLEKPALIAFENRQIRKIKIYWDDVLIMGVEFTDEKG